MNGLAEAIWATCRRWVVPIAETIERFLLSYIGYVSIVNLMKSFPLLHKKSSSSPSKAKRPMKRPTWISSSQDIVTYKSILRSSSEITRCNKSPEKFRLSLLSYEEALALKVLVFASQQFNKQVLFILWILNMASFRAELISYSDTSLISSMDIVSSLPT